MILTDWPSLNVTPCPGKDRLLVYLDLHCEQTCSVLYVALGALLKHKITLQQNSQAFILLTSKISGSEIEFIHIFLPTRIVFLVCANILYCRTPGVSPSHNFIFLNSLQVHIHIVDINLHKSEK